MARGAAYAALAARLAAGGRALLDGGVGTEIQRRGGSLQAWAAAANAERPELVRAVHADFLAAGADVISANTFGCSEPRLAAWGLAGREEELNRAAVALALEARDEAASGASALEARDEAGSGALALEARGEAGSGASALEARDEAGSGALVAGCLTTVSYRGPDGSEMSPPEGERALESQARILADAGADLLLVEILASVERANAMLGASASAGLPIWAGFSCKRGDDGQLRLLNEPDEPLADSLRRVDLSGVDAALVMHTRIAEVGPALAALREAWGGPTGAYPHGGRYARPDWEFDASFTPDALAAGASQWLADGCQIAGGCCGASPAHIAALRKVLDAER